MSVTSLLLILASCLLHHAEDRVCPHNGLVVLDRDRKGARGGQRHEAVERQQADVRRRRSDVDEAGGEPGAAPPLARGDGPLAVPAPPQDDQRRPGELRRPAGRLHVLEGPSIRRFILAKTKSISNSPEISGQHKHM